MEFAVSINEWFLVLQVENLRIDTIRELPPGKSKVRGITRHRGLSTIYLMCLEVRVSAGVRPCKFVEFGFRFLP